MKSGKFPFDDIPSAPPFFGSQEIKEGVEIASGTHKGVDTATSCGFSANNYPDKTKNINGVESKDNIGGKNPDQFVRYV